MDLKRADNIADTVVLCRRFTDMINDIDSAIRTGGTVGEVSFTFPRHMMPKLREVIAEELELLRTELEQF